MGPTIEMLNDLADAWFGSILRATWQGGLAIAVAWVLVRCWPRLPHRVGCWIWRLADLKLIVALLWATPLLLPVLPPPTHPEPLASRIAAPNLSPSPAGGSEPSTFRAGEPAVTPVSHRSIPACVMFIFWLSGVVGAAILAGRARRVASRLRQSCRLIDRPDLRDATSELACVLGLRSVPELRAGTAVARPMLVGAFRPAILLPVAMLPDPHSTVAVRPVLAHELAHVRRRDLLWSGMAGVVRALFFFHPLVWLAQREGLLAREAACDALALRASGVRPSDYAHLLLDIAAGGLDRPAQWAANLGMTGSAGSLKRRLMAMNTTQPPSRRRLLSWAFALLAVGAAGVIPWRLVPRQALAQKSPPVLLAKEPARAGQDDRAPAIQRDDLLKVAEARLKVAQAERRVAEVLVEQAEAETTAAAAQREYRGKQRDRLAQLAKRGAIEVALVDEQEARFGEAQAAEHEAKEKLAVSRASLKAAKAAVREAEALRDITRAESRVAPDVEKHLKEALARLHDARLDRARAQRDAARAEIDRAEAKLKKSKATVEYQTKVFERIKQLAERRAVEQRLVDELGQAVIEARNAQREAEVAVRLARTRLEAAAARLEAAKDDAIDRGPITPPRVAPR